ncbi:MAG TPA: O-antigen polysaccharide polymerase Wzy, partial [Anaeromyxobacteraceae bacterium]|nr:O-antigen polysaccharide polymerase Wzy [Anaeromyxobacteraceae bacterium]
FWRGVMDIGLLSGTYAEYYDRPAGKDVRFFGLGIMLFPIGVLLAAVGATPSQLKLVALAYALVVGPVFLAGFRGPVLAHAMALLAIWLRKDPRTALRTAAGVAVLALVLVPAIRVSRNAESTLGAGARTAKPIEVFTEAGGSIRPLVVATERVETGREPLWWGRSYAMAAERLAFNLGPKPKADPRRLTPNQWATMHDHPWAFENGGGIGFSGVAEPYLNFGRAGMVAFFVLLGLVLALGDRALARNHYVAALILSSFGFVLWTVRNDSMDLVRASGIAAMLVAGAWAIASVRPKSLPVMEARSS